MDEDGIGFELVAASLRADSGDSTAFLAALAAKLSGALPQQTVVRSGGGHFGKKTIKSIDVDLGEVRFHVESGQGTLATSRQKAVRGIVLKNESIPIDVWIDELSQNLAEAARESEAGRVALQRMLEGS